MQAKITSDGIFVPREHPAIEQVMHTLKDAEGKDWPHGSKAYATVYAELTAHLELQRTYIHDGQQVQVDAIGPIYGYYRLTCSNVSFSERYLSKVRSELTPGGCFRQLDTLIIGQVRS